MSTERFFIKGISITSCIVPIAILVMSFVSSRSMARAQGIWSKPQPMAQINTAEDEYAPSWDYVTGTFSCTQERNHRARIMVMDSNRVLQEMPLPGLSSGSQCSYSSWSRTGIMVFCAFRPTYRGRTLNIMERRHTNGVWGSANFIDECASDTFTAHASISPSGSTLVFTSDREGGVGKLDLWMCKRSGSMWDTPVHMGELLNSEQNEISPFLASDDTLYFAGDGFGGRGGYDVYRTVRVAGEWQPPIPLDDVNTSFDESDFVVLPSGNAVFVSNRTGGRGGLDLYSCEKK